MTGSGKTFSLLGPMPEAVPLLGGRGNLGGGADGAPAAGSLHGIVPRFLRRLLALAKETHRRCGLDEGGGTAVKEGEVSTVRELHAVTVEISFMEIYAEKMRDLLAPSLGPDG